MKVLNLFKAKFMAVVKHHGFLAVRAHISGLNTPSQKKKQTKKKRVGNLRTLLKW